MTKKHPLAFTYRAQAPDGHRPPLGRPPAARRSALGRPPLAWGEGSGWP